MKFVIVGAGAIGRLFGALLSRGGNEVAFVETKQEVVDAINDAGIGYLDIGATGSDAMTYFPAKASVDGKEIKDCDAVIIAVKSYDTLAAIKSIAHLITGNTPALSIQTGLGNIEIMEKVVPRKDIVGGFTYMAGAALGPGQVRHGGFGKTKIGALDGKRSPRVDMLNKVFNECGIACEVLPQIIGSLWCKVIVYSAINPVTAILRIKNGQLLEKMESVNLMKRLVDEGREVAEASAVQLGCYDLYDLLFDTCRHTYDNISSMLQDILNKHMTEIDALNGALCQYGEEKGIQLPTHHTIIQIVKLLEKWQEGFE